MAEQEEDFSSLPLPDRFAHKNWKVRKEGYEAAAKEFNNAQTESDPIVREFLLDSGIWKAAVSDSNVAAHQEALVALCSFLNIAGSQGCTRTRGSTIGHLVEKGLTSTKATAKQKAMEAILLYVELDKPDPVIEELMPTLSHKLPKIVAATLSALTSICHEYGCKTVDPKPIVKVLPKAFGHADKTVRTEAQNLTTELYRWLREGMKPLFWNDLKPVQQQDLEKLFDKVKDEPAPRPERLLRSQQAAVATASPAAGSAGDDEDPGVEEEQAEYEPDFMTVDVMARIPKDFEERLSSTKWKDRKEALDDLHTAINVPAMEEGQFNDIMQGLAKCMKDANIMVVTTAANCVELFAKGLRRAFAKYRGVVLKPLIERLKEKKQSVTDALGAALDAVCAATSLSECLEDIMEATKDKNPNVKLETTRFLVRALKTSREAPSIPEVNTISEGAKKLVTDSQEVQRNAAAEVLGVLLKMMGERIMNSHFEGLDDIKKGKIKEFSESAEVRAKYKPKSAAPPAKAGPPPSLGQKRPALAVKKPLGGGVLGARKPAGGDDETGPAPLQPKPTARSAISRPGVAAPGTKGLKAPASGLGIKKPSPVGTAASPRRSERSATPDEPPTPAAKASRGLPGRQLGKPLGQTTEPQSAPTPSASSFSSTDRIELDTLRSEADRLRSSNETLRTENTKLHSQVRDLQEQNSHLIEDHTRDILSIKAKETQLVRARSDAESAEQTSTQLQREVDRLKRELMRLTREDASHADEDDYRTNNPDVFQESDQPSRQRNAVISPTSAGGKENELLLDEEEHLQPAVSRVAEREKPTKFAGQSRLLSSSRVAGIPRPSSYSASPARPSSIATSNGSSIASRINNGPLSPPADSAASRDLGDDDYVQVEGTDAPPPPYTRPANASAGRPLSGISRGIPRTTGAAGAGMKRMGEGGAVPAGQESWRRAAEVTQNLKARIELMKQRQGAAKN